MEPKKKTRTNYEGYWDIEIGKAFGTRYYHCPMCKAVHEEEFGRRPTYCCYCGFKDITNTERNNRK
jgi:hypothetical protein